MITAKITNAADGGPATHTMIVNGRKYRKGANRFAETYDDDGDRWYVTAWNNHELDTCRFFERIDGKPGEK